jgi:protein involved in polysaccharide export with SLBB domain
VYLGQLLVTRLQPDSTRVQLRAALRDTTGAVVGDFPLQEDDEIRLFSVSEFRPDRYVAISGSVRKPGQYPFREGMTMRDLVLLAGGIEESAYLREAEIARLPQDRANGVTAQTFRAQMDSSYLFERGRDGEYFGPPGLQTATGAAPEVPLKPYDNVLILQQPDWELQRNVYLGGEVRFPGRYALERKSERLTDLIKRAGGLTTEAYAEGVFFYRGGRIGIDLPTAMKQYRNQDNLLLQDGDSVFIPRYNAVVNVAGEVNSPVAVSYVPGEDLDYYVRAAGGPSQKADLSRAYVTQPNGKVESIERRRLLPDGVPEPRAGSSVFVPAAAAVPRDPLAVAGTIVGIIGSLATAVLTIIAINRTR